MSVVIIIFIYNCNYILELWLGNVPAYTVILLDICFFEVFFDVITSNLKIGIHAAGKIRKYSVSQGIVKLMVIPLAILCLLVAKKPEHIYIINTLSTFICMVLSVYYLKENIPYFSIRDFIFNLGSMILPIVPTVVILLFLNELRLSDSVSLLSSSGVILVCMTLFSYIFLGYKNRQVVNTIVKYKLFKKFNS